jgi:hypothetical protein
LFLLLSPPFFGLQEKKEKFSSKKIHKRGAVAKTKSTSRRISLFHLTFAWLDLFLYVLAQPPKKVDEKNSEKHRKDAKATSPTTTTSTSPTASSTKAPETKKKPTKRGGGGGGGRVDLSYDPADFDYEDEEEEYYEPEEKAEVLDVSFACLLACLLVCWQLLSIHSQIFLLFFG